MSLPSATIDVVMSRIAGGAPASGTPMASGLVDRRRSLPPKGATRCAPEVLRKCSETCPASAAISAQSPSRPRCPQLRRPTKAIPCRAALPMPSLRRELAGDLAEAAIAVDDRERVVLEHDRGRRVGPQPLAAHPLEILAHADHAVRVVSHEIGIDEAAGNRARLLGIGAASRHHGGDEIDELGCGNRAHGDVDFRSWRGGHGDYTKPLPRMTRAADHRDGVIVSGALRLALRPAAQPDAPRPSEPAATPRDFAPMTHKPRIALVYDWLDTWRGGENVLAQVVRLYPDADLFALVDFLPEALRPRLARQARAHHLPAAHCPARAGTSARCCRSFRARSSRSTCRRYDLVLSISHAVAKGVRTRAAPIARLLLPHADALRLGPARAVPRDARGLGRGLRGAIVHRVLDRLREWDRRSSARVDALHRQLARSSRDRIARCYGRDGHGHLSAGRHRLLHAAARHRAAVARLLLRRLALGSVQADRRRSPPRFAQLPERAARRSPATARKPRACARPPAPT